MHSKLGVVSACLGLYLVLETAAGLGTRCGFLSIGLLLYLLGGSCVLVLTVVSLVYALRHVRTSGRRVFLPLGLNLLTITTVLTLPLQVWWTTLFFQVNRPQFEQVVALVESGQLRPDELHHAQLPLRYRYLSRCGGQILIDQQGATTRVFFFTYRDMFDDFAGYLYRSDMSPPQPSDFPARVPRLRSWTGFKWLRPHWYSCSNV